MAKQPTPPVAGRLVRFVLADGPSAGQIRPAIIVAVDEKNGPTLQVFTAGDGTPYTGDCLPAVLLKQAAPYNEEPVPGSWHWPEIPKPTEPAK